MSKPEIKYENIPDEEIETSADELVKKRYWYPKRQKSKLQSNDTIYIELKNYFINFFYSQPKTQFLYWAPIYKEESGNEEGDSIDVDKNIDAGNCPITIEYLNFVRGGCGDCGIICEIFEFGGEILINDKKYEYEGHTNSERWCERDYLKQTRMSDKEILDGLKDPEILFKLYIHNCPNVMFFRNYTSINDFRLK